MNYSAFITSENFPNLAMAFASSVSSVCLSSQEEEALISVIGEPGVGKSYVARKLSQGVLGQGMVTEVQAVAREAQPDLILWASHANEENQIIQYDEASLRFVDVQYRDLVMSSREKFPIPGRYSSGLTFIEHPDLETESKSDIVARLSFSTAQKQAIEAIHATVNSVRCDLDVCKKELSRVASKGCLLEMNFSGKLVDEAPLIEFFDKNPERTDVAGGYSEDYDWEPTGNS